jgi:DNA-directed RNA polymerase subunit RPC12/RpoP
MQVTDKEYTCTMCSEHFRIDSEVEALQASQDFTEGIQCPACREVTDHKRGSGRDEGQSHIHYGPCSQCGSQTEYFALPNGEHTSQCPECGRAYSSSSY